VPVHQLRDGSGRPADTFFWVYVDAQLGSSDKNNGWERRLRDFAEKIRTSVGIVDGTAVSLAPDAVLHLLKPRFLLVDLGL